MAKRQQQTAVRLFLGVRKPENYGRPFLKITRTHLAKTENVTTTDSHP